MGTINCLKYVAGELMVEFAVDASEIGRREGISAEQ